MIAAVSGPPGPMSMPWMAVMSASSPCSRAIAEIARARSTSRALGPHQSSAWVRSFTVTPSWRMSTPVPISPIRGSAAIATTKAAEAANDGARKNAFAPSTTTRQSPTPSDASNRDGVR